MGAPKRHEVETTCINTLMSGSYGLTVTQEAQESMRSAGVDLPDVHHVGSTGRVVRSGMMDHRGLWVVRGETVDGVIIDITVAVISSEYDVELLKVCSVIKRGGVS